MNWTVLTALAGLALSAATFLMVAWRGRKSEVREDDKAIAKLDGRITVLEGRADQTDVDMTETKKNAALLPVISAQIAALDRLMGFRIDDVQGQIRSLDKRVEQGLGGNKN